MCAVSNKIHSRRHLHHGAVARVRQFSVGPRPSQKRIVAPWFDGGFRLDFTAVALHDALHRREPQAVPRKFVLPVQAR